MPDPMTTAARKALPANSATRRRQRTTSFMPDSVRSFGRSCSAAGRGGDGSARNGVTGIRAARPVAGDPRFDRCVGQDGVDLPRRGIGVLDPDLVLDGEATRGV